MIACDCSAAKMVMWVESSSQVQHHGAMVLKAEAAAELHVMDYLELLCLQPIWPVSSCCSAVYKLLCRRHDT